jgi:hypothetical protein
VPPLHGLLLLFRGYVRHPCLVPCDYAAQCIVSESSTHWPVVSFLCSSVSIFGTQHEHNFRKRSLSDTISWRSDCEICGKCRQSDEMVNCLFSWIFSSIASTKLLRGSSCTFLHPSSKCLTHLRTTE